MAQNLTYNQLYQLALDAGFKGASALTMAAVAMAESGGDPKIQHVNDDGSIDNGVLQINNKAHPNISVEQADNPQAAFQAAYQISSSGMNFNPWTTYKTGAWKKYVPIGNQIDPGTGKPFKVDPRNQPADQQTVGKPGSKPGSGQVQQAQDKGNPLQQAAGAFNQWRGDVGKDAAQHNSGSGDGGGGGFLSGLANAPIRVVKVILGLLLIGSSLILLLLPPVVAVAKSAIVPELKGAVRRPVKEHTNRVLNRMHLKTVKPSKSKTVKPSNSGTVKA
jgi:hypothetical protein